MAAVADTANDSASLPGGPPGPGADTLLGLHDPGQPWEQWGCPIDGCGQWFLGPGELEWHTAAEHLGGTATYQLLRPLPEPAPAGRVLALTRTQADAA